MLVSDADGIASCCADPLETYLMTEDLGEIEYLDQRHHRWVKKEAAGVVGAIIAYNYPNQLALAKLIGRQHFRHSVLSGR